ncbi:hydrogenase maturation protein [Azospirillum soli]|uniref:hydrogenase maturation protein n=1 Tax=Azospirillum soli TaxID=1304799 RepID=UPI001AEA52D2|nr:hydrogenase maturation protein [Azospirillum soli]MBP2314777.1 putative two-component system hydrogenase maturation factor HypX/HoxX [Azospirillum soli]
MRILILCHAFNSLAQRLYVELAERGHTLSLEFDINDSVTREAVGLFGPDLVLAPFLKRAIPEDVWRRVPCLVVHPGPLGDRGPSALDWVVLEGAKRWGVTLLHANAEMDAGDVWRSVPFETRDAAKASLYRHEVTEAAVEAVLDALERLKAGGKPTPFDPADPAAFGRPRPPMTQADRAIDWSADETATVLRKIRSGDGVPGVRDRIGGLDVNLFDAHPEATLRGAPGALIARCEGAVCRATVDGAVWIGHLKARDAETSLKLPATQVLGEAAAALPEAPGYRDLWYEEEDGVGWLHFPFYNGAMSARQCERLLAAYHAACRRDVRVIVLAGGEDFWSNGIHLNVIEAAHSPADESWRTINAIDDLARAILTTGDKLTVAALSGNAGAGGVFLALAADRVWARSGVVLNPHYKGMGNLYGSEYWTYVLPRRAGEEHARAVTEARLPMGTAQAHRLGLVDEAFGRRVADFRAGVRDRARALAADPALALLLEEKRQRRAADEAAKPLDSYRAEELERMRLNFYGFDPSYHVARYNFVLKVPKSRTPLYLARHRRVAKVT